MIKILILLSLLCHAWLRFNSNLSKLILCNNHKISCLNSIIKFLKFFVKEQRVDGSWGLVKNGKKVTTIIKAKSLRCTLMGFERNYQINIPSNQLKIKKYSTFNIPKKINPWFWTGLLDAESSFSVIIDKNLKRKIGWRVQTKFQIGLHKRDLPLLLQLQKFLGGIGSVHVSSSLNKINYSIDSKEDLIILINHLDKYPLLTQKAADYILFKEVVNLIKNKAHLSYEGLNKIINIKASINLGLSDLLKAEFKNFNPVERPKINTKEIPNSSWVAGFVSGEGNFDVLTTPQAGNKNKYRVQLRFRITQHERDKNLMELIIKYLNSGKLYKHSDKPALVITVSKFSDIKNKIIPFFDNEKNSIQGVKLLDYLDWCKIAKLIDEGSHLTLEGLEKILRIKKNMNTGRDYSNI